MPSRRSFLRTTAAVAAAQSLSPLLAQSAGDRPAEHPGGAQVINPRGRVPLSHIIDDSTCLVNLNRFAMPQFDAAWEGKRDVYHKPWRDWPVEIPDSFVRKFGEWCASQGVKGKYSIVPYPACVGRLDREVPGWTAREISDSVALVRDLMMPNWDIHPEMVTHTRVIDLKTGHPYPDRSPKFMENWDWTTGRSADEIGAYLAYALQILKNVGLPCEGVTTPGGFGNKALPQLSQASLQSVRDVFKAEIPHYFRHAFSSGDKSVAPRVELATGLDGPSPECVVSIIACTGDWTGGWDNTPPDGVDKFITADGKSGRMVEIIARGEPAIMLCHWTGFHFNGAETGFKIFQETVKRLHEHYGNLHWMKLSEISRYWAAKELTAISRDGESVVFRAPFACPEFTVQFTSQSTRAPHWRTNDQVGTLREAARPLQLAPGTWHRDGQRVTVCFPLPRGESRIEFAA